jgi:hypothetical protein
MRYAEATWASFTAMVDTSSGLPTDQLNANGTTDVQTSTTNIGAYLWSAVAPSVSASSAAPSWSTG